MAVPKKKTSHRRTRQRRSHNALTKPNLASCSKCGEMVLPHTVCENCGFYGERKIIDVESNLAKKLKKKENGKEND